MRFCREDSILYVVEVGKCVLNEGDCRKKEDGLVVKAFECHHGEVDYVTLCHREFM